MARQRYIITGVDDRTGEPLRLRVRAESQEDAARVGAENGIRDMHVRVTSRYITWVWLLLVVALVVALLFVIGSSWLLSWWPLSYPRLL